MKVEPSPKSIPSSLRGMWSFLFVVILTMTPTILVAFSDSAVYESASYYILFLSVVLMSGTLIQLAPRGGVVVRPHHKTSIANVRALDALYFCVTGLSVAHYTLLGQVPLFSPQIDTIRFQAASSGYLGIPSRGATIGPIILLAFTFACWPQLSLRRRVPYAIIIVMLYALRGHKSAILELVVTILLIAPWRLSIRFASYAAGSFIASILFAYAAAQRFTTLDLQTGFSSYLFDRAALMQHRLVTFLIYKSIRYDAHSLLVDMFYPILKVLSPATQTLNEKISALYYGFSFNSFTVPVTPGPVGLGVLLGGGPGVFLVGLITPAIALWLARARGNENLFARGNANFMTATLFVGLTTGNPFYWISNSLLSEGIILGISAFVYALSSIRRPNLSRYAALRQRYVRGSVSSGGSGATR